jgi:hypothetical protein
VARRSGAEHWLKVGVIAAAAVVLYDKVLKPKFKL